MSFRIVNRGRNGTERDQKSPPSLAAGRGDEGGKTVCGAGGRCRRFRAPRTKYDTLCYAFGAFGSLGRRKKSRISRPQPLKKWPLQMVSRSSAMGMVTAPSSILAIPRKGML